MNETIVINAITSHLDILKNIIYWIFAFSLIAGWSVYRGNKTIDLAGFSLETKTAYKYVVWFYVVINFAVLILFFRINELIVNFGFTGRNSSTVYAAIKSHAWVLNPFSDFSYNLVPTNGAISSDWKQWDIIINYISSGFGCFALLLVWRIAHLVLKFTQNGWNKSISIVIADSLLILFFFLWIFQIFLIINNMGANPWPPAIGAFLGFGLGFYLFGMSLFYFKTE